MVIHKKTIRKFAPLYYEDVKAHLRALKSAQRRTGKYPEFRHVIEMFMGTSGMSAADLLLDGYDPKMLDNEEFRTVVILYSCTCLMTDCYRLSVTGFRDYLGYIQNVQGRELDAIDALKYFSDIMDIDADIVPEYVKNSMAQVFEERAANKVCDKSLGTIDSPDNYASFELYWEYIEKNAQDLINKLITQGYTHTYPLDLFTHLIILRQLNFPIGTLYSIQQSLPAPRGIIDVLSKKLFELKKSGGFQSDGGGFIGLGGSDIGD